MHVAETGNVTYAIIILEKKNLWYNIGRYAKELVKLANKIHIRVEIINLGVKGIVFFICESGFIS